MLEALEMVNKGVQIVGMHPEMKQATDAYTAFIQEHDAVDATLALAKIVPNADKKWDLFLDLPDPIRSRKEVRDVLVVPTLLKNADADVTIFCGPSLDDWGPTTPARTGIGGSETAVIEMAMRLAQKGLSVNVYNQCSLYEGMGYYSPREGYKQVRYIDYSRYDPTRPTKLFVAWRNPGVPKPPCDQAWRWVHDLNVGPNLRAEHTAPFDLVRPVSQWHGQHLAWLYPFLKEKIAPTRNGVDLARFGWGQVSDAYYDPLLQTWKPPNNPAYNRFPHRALWTSSPDRAAPVQPVTLGPGQAVSLTVPPIDLNLLGLVLQTSAITVNASSQTGNGLLLGNVPTTILNTLGATPANLSQLSNNLNAVLAKVVGVLNASMLTLPANALSSLPTVLQTLSSPTLLTVVENGQRTDPQPVIASPNGSTTPPVDVNLLGLNVTTSNITAQLLAQTGNGEIWATCSITSPTCSTRASPRLCSSCWPSSTSSPFKDAGADVLVHGFFVGLLLGQCVWVTSAVPDARGQVTGGQVTV